MVTFLQLGRHGRFGNQLFQIAATIGLAKRNGHEFIFPFWDPAEYFQHPPPQAREPILPHVFVDEKGFGYSEIDLPKDNEIIVSLHGYFQSPRFFNHCDESIKAYYAPSATVVAEINFRYGVWLNERPTCAVYVRRGDYAQYPDHHPMQKLEYYQNAMDHFEKSTLFMVSSDDMAWCEQNFSNRECVFLHDESFVHSFFVGTLCRNVIISNSTFGWWAAWLNRNRKFVIAPRLWFGPAYAHQDTRDLIPDDWIVL